ncbi:hypothetical protein MTR67_035257, partial [Solanum verrucosum]
ILRACVIYLKGNWYDQLSLIAFAYNNSYHSSIGMTSFEDLYGTRCRSPRGWFEMVQSQQKSYVNVRISDREFDIDDWIYLKISPMKGVIRFGNKGKLSPHYVGPYQVLRWIGMMAYQLNLPFDLSLLNLVFHVPLLKKCISDPTSIIPLKSLGIKKILSYEEVPVEILDWEVRKLRNKEVASVKVLWRNQMVEGATWETNADMIS